MSAVLVAGLQHLGESWQVIWLASGAVTFVALLATAGLLPEGTSPTVRSTSEGRGAIDRGLRRLMIAYGLFGFGYVITATFLVTIVRATPTIRPFEPVIWIVFGIAAVPSVTLWTRLAQPIGIPATFAIACIVEAAGVLASVAWPTTLGVFLAAILVGGTFMGLTALGLMGARARVIGDPRRALALMTGAFGFGQIIGPIFAGFASDRRAVPLHPPLSRHSGSSRLRYLPRHEFGPECFVIAASSSFRNRCGLTWSGVAHDPNPCVYRKLYPF